MKFNRIIISHLLLFCFSILSSCNSEIVQLKNEIVEFKKTSIVMPCNIICVQNGVMKDLPKLLSPKATIVVFFDESNCFDCNITHLSDIIPLYSLAADLGLSIFCLFSPNEEQLPNVITSLKKAIFPYEVYVDIDNAFKALNSDFPDDKRFHIFCLDVNSKPVFVGNPCSSKKAYRNFLKAIKAKPADH